MTGIAIAAAATAWIAYCVVLYPLIILVVGRLRPMVVRSDASFRPRVTLIVTAKNEEGSVVDKIRNALASDYPEERLRVLLVSDGSTDRTVELGSQLKREYPDRFDVLAFPDSRGKTAALMDGVGRVRDSCDVIVMSDANSFFEREAIGRLATNFADERVGCVAGELRYRSKTGEKAYRGMENKLREWESRVGVTVGAEGAIYAVRASIVPSIPADLIDDFTIPLLIQSSRRRVVYEPGAVALEEFGLNWHQQYSRRIRIVNRCVRSSAFIPGLYNPLRSPLASFAFLSHRMLRWTIALPMLTLLVVCALQLSAHFPFNLLVVVPAAFVSWVAIGWILRDRAAAPRLLSAGLFGSLAVTAMLLGVLSAISGRRIVKWTPQRA